MDTMATHAIPWDASAVVQAIQRLDRHDALAPWLASHAAEVVNHRETRVSALQHVSASCRMAGLDAECIAAVESLAARVVDDPLLAVLYVHCSRLAFDLIKLYPDDHIDQWPSFEAILPGEGDLFTLLIALSAVPVIQRVHQPLKIPTQITVDTCRDIPRRADMTSAAVDGGRIRLPVGRLKWLRYHAKGELFELGRLQFHITIFDEPVLAYRRIGRGETMVVAEPGHRFTADGFYDGPGDVLHEDVWYSTWRQAAGQITANRFSESGRATRTPVSFDAKQWRLTVDSSSAVMNAHIPSGDRLTFEAWDEAIRRGFAFFRELRPTSPAPVACACKSWLFDPRLRDLLADTSTLIQLQKRVHIFPRCLPTTRHGLHHIFGDADIDPATAPRDTSLRRVVADHLSTGGALTGGIMLTFEDELA